MNKFFNIYFSREEVFSVFFKFITSLSLVLSNVIVSRYFTNEQLSLFYLIVPITTFFSMVFVSPISIFLTNTSIVKKNNIYNRVNEYLLYLIMLAFLFIIPLQFFLFKINFLTRFILAFYICIEITLGTVAGIIIQNESTFGYLKKSVFFSFFISTTSILFPIIIGFIWGWNINSWIIGLIIGRFSQIPFFTKATDINFTLKDIKNKYFLFINEIKLSFFSILKLLFNSIISWLQNNFSIFFISLFLGLNSGAPYLYVYSISATLANLSESVIKPILDRKIFTIIHGDSNDKKEFNPFYLYFFISFFGFILIPFIGNLLSKNRYYDYMQLSRIFFLFEFFKLFLNYKLSIFQIKYGYNTPLKINSILLIIYLISISFLNFFTKINLAFNYIYIFLFLIVILLIKLTPSINKMRTSL